MGAPCLIHTPPIRTMLLHPSRLHLLTFAPCLTHTPPSFNTLVHPSWLHNFLFCPQAYLPPLFCSRNDLGDKDVSPSSFNTNFLLRLVRCWIEIFEVIVDFSGTTTGVGISCSFANNRGDFL